MIDLKFYIDNLWIIILLVSTGLLSIFSLILLFFLCCKKKKKINLTNKYTETDNITIVQYDDNGYSHINGNYIHYTIFD